MINRSHGSFVCGFENRTKRTDKAHKGYVCAFFVRVIPDGIYYIKNAATQMYKELESASSPEEVPIQYNAINTGFYGGC